MSDLFSATRHEFEEIYPDIYVLPQFVDPTVLLLEVDKVIAQAPFRKMMTPMGHYTGVALSNCGEYGWTSDLQGYRYSKQDPQTGNFWPPLPESYLNLAKRAASKAGFNNFEPDACLINRYKLGDKLGSHQDKNEKDFAQPIVSVSIGLSAVFQIFGETRAGVKVEYLLQSGDVMVWGRKSRLAYHGIRTIKVDTLNPKLTQRINITFRKSN